MKVNLLRFFLFAILELSNITVYSTVYYVSETGNNSNNGLSPQTAFATLQYAADLVSAGDSVLVLAGNYVGFDIRTNGNVNNPIVIKAI